MPGPDDGLTWTIHERRAVSSHYVFDVREHDATHPTRGNQRTFTTLDCAPWVNVLALTPHDEVLFVRQYRHGVERLTLELPGGLVDPGEDPMQAAVRELREETGHEASTFVLLGEVEPNPAIQNNRCALVLALDARPTATQDLDDGEAIAVESLPLGECSAAVFDGRITHSLVVCTFFAYRERVGGWHRPDAATLERLLLDD